MFSDFKWLNEPPVWEGNESKFTLITGNETDFWQRTFYDFQRKDGHFFYIDYEGDFTCEVNLVADFEVLYDQLGLMVRVDDENWIKTGLEYTDGAAHISTVVTRTWSDWSMIKPTKFEGEVRIRLTRHGEAIRIQYLDEHSVWIMLRLAYLDMSESCQIGIMACSPQRSGFVANFSDFRMGDPISRNLHD